MKLLQGQVAVVTGHSRGIGQAVAAALAAAGADVTGGARSTGCDVSQEADVTRLFERLTRLDILVNNAAILTPRGSFAEVSAADWDATLAVNVRGVFLCTRAALRLMLPQRRGLIINVSSGAGKRAVPGWGPYAVSKWAVEGLTRCLAAEVAVAGIRVVAINPGATRTAMRARAYPLEDPGTLSPPAAVGRFVVDLATGKIPFQTGDSLDYNPR